MLKRIEHIAVAVADLDAAIELYKKVWGLEVEHREVVEDQGVEEAMLPLGESYIQLLAPLTPESTVGRFVERRGGGLHHIAYEVDNIENALQGLIKEGAQLVDKTPRRGSRGTKVAFVHPKGNMGLLVELVETPGAPRT